ncbi:MAG: branched-chain amino acid ABC transporter permease [Firmicutes bacterium]|nr:branched-chain amino acid ABC transporter permease [Bacillota bacterium]
MGIFLTLALNGIVNGSLYFLMAAGLTLIFGLMRVVNFAHGGLYQWGAYLATFVFATTDNFVLALAVGMLIAIILGIVMERGLISFVYHNENGQLLVTMGIMLILTELIKVPFGPSELSSNTPTDLSNSWLVGQVVIVQYQLFMIGASIVVFILLLWILHKTRLGMIVRAGVYNPELVEACGIAIGRVFTIVFALGAGLAGLAGALAGPYLGAVTPTMGFDMQLSAFIIVVVGGLGSLTGSFIGSMIIGILTAVVSFYFSSLAVLVNVVVMVIVLLIRPQGLFGERESAT